MCSLAAAEQLNVCIGRDIYSNTVSLSFHFNGCFNETRDACIGSALGLGEGGITKKHFIFWIMIYVCGKDYSGGGDGGQSRV